MISNGLTSTHNKMSLALKNVIQLDVKIGRVRASGGARDVLPIFIVFQKGFDEICANTLAVDHSASLRPVTDYIKENLTNDKKNKVPDFKLKQNKNQSYGVDYQTKIDNVKKGIDHQITGDLLASLGVVLKNVQKIPKGYMTEYDVGYNANQEGARFESGVPSSEFKSFDPEKEISPYPLVEQAWEANGKKALNLMKFSVLLNFEQLWAGGQA